MGEGPYGGDPNPSADSCTGCATCSRRTGGGAAVPDDRDARHGGVGGHGRSLPSPPCRTPVRPPCRCRIRPAPPGTADVDRHGRTVVRTGESGPGRRPDRGDRTGAPGRARMHRPSSAGVRPAAAPSGRRPIRAPSWGGSWPTTERGQTNAQTYGEQSAEFGCASVDRARRGPSRPSYDPVVVAPNTSASASSGVFPATILALIFTALTALVAPVWSTTAMASRMIAR